MRRTRRKYNTQGRSVEINEGIRSPELRIIDDERGNLGVMPRAEALALAKEQGLDLIEISPEAKPPVAKIMDYGKFMYGFKKKMKEIRQKVKSGTVEIKNVQVKVGTGKNDMVLKSSRADEWLIEGQRVKCELFLKGRSKYMERSFLESRLNKFLEFITTPYKIVEPMKKIPKGLSVILEGDKKEIAKLLKKKEKEAKEIEGTKEQEPEKEPLETDKSKEQEIIEEKE